MYSCLILAGGRSSRLPFDKTRLELGGRLIIERQMDLLEAVFPNIIIVANRERYPELTQYHGNGIRVIEEEIRGVGPLGGIYSGLAATTTPLNFVVGCDMPFLHRGVIEYLLERIGSALAAVPVSPSGIEPLHGVYHRDCREPMMRQLEKGKFKISDFLKLVEVKYVPLAELEIIDPTGRFLFNLNTIDDIRIAEELFLENHIG